MSNCFFYAQEAVESVSETLMVAAVTQAAPTEEPIPVDPAAETEELPNTSAESLMPVTVSEEHIDPKPSEPASFEAATFETEVTAVKEDANAAEEDDLEEPITEIPTKESEEMVQTSLVEDISSSLELMSVQEKSPATDASRVACASETVSPVTDVETSETIATKEAPTEAGETEAIATEDGKVATAPLVTDDTVAASEAVVTSEMPIAEAEGTDLFASEPAADETPLTGGLVSEFAPPPVAVEELITFENPASAAVDVPPLVPVPVPTFPELSLDPVPELEPVPAQHLAQGEETIAQPDPTLVSPVPAPQEAEPGGVSPAAAPSEEEAGPGEEAAEDLEAELDEVKTEGL